MPLIHRTHRTSTHPRLDAETQDRVPTWPPQRSSETRPSDDIAVEDILKPGGRTTVRQSFLVESGRPGAQPV
jgi:hypothetical protein